MDFFDSSFDLICGIYLPHYFIELSELFVFFQILWRLIVIFCRHQDNLEQREENGDNEYYAPVLESHKRAGCAINFLIINRFKLKGICDTKI
jgi:hypothetical protein